MDNTNEILELIEKINIKQDEKREYAKEQNYIGAANARDTERTLLNQLDKKSGVKDFFKKVYESEKTLRHLEEIVNSSEELKKLGHKFPDILNRVAINEMLVKVYQYRDEAYSAVLNVREKIN